MYFAPLYVRNNASEGEPCEPFPHLGQVIVTQVNPFWRFLDLITVGSDLKNAKFGVFGLDYGWYRSKKRPSLAFLDLITVGGDLKNAKFDVFGLDYGW